MAKDIRVFLDAGHGGKDSGATGVLNGKMYKEKDITLAVIKYAEEYLKNNYEIAGENVRRSRYGDEDKTLKERTDMANQGKAELFISIHVNSYHDSSANGYESFIHSSGYANEKKLQNSIHDKVFVVCKKFGVNQDRGKKLENFYVLRESKMPAVLLELGFISNQQNLRVVIQTDFQKEVGKAIALSVAEYLNLKKKLPVSNAGSKVLYRVMVDGTQVGSYEKIENIINQIEQAVKNKKSKIELVKVSV